MQNSDLYYSKHVFMCENMRDEDNVRGCCARKNSGKLREYLKKKCKAASVSKVRINGAGCLDRCELGAVMVIYPEGIWYHYATESDLDEILESHIQNNRLVERLLLKVDQKRL